MQQATCAHSGADTGTSSGNTQNISAFFASRRSILTGTLGAIGALTVSTGAGATGRCLRSLHSPPLLQRITRQRPASVPCRTIWNAPILHGMRPRKN